MGWFKKNNNAGYPAGRSTALLAGSGTSASPVTITTASNFLGYWVKSSVASGDVRGMYLKLTLSGAAGGEALRAWAAAGGTGVATGGTINGIHATMSVDAGATVSGSGNAIRATLGAASATRTLGGTCAALELDTDIGANNTVPGSYSLIRLTKSGTVDVPLFLDIADDQCLKGSAASGAASDALKVQLPDGTIRYISLVAAS